MKNADSHIYLYAKGHYERSPDILQDLKVLVGQRCGIETEDLTVLDIAEVVLAITMPYLMKSQHQLRNFVLGLDERRYWEVARREDPYTFDKALVRRCLSVLSMTTVKGKNGEILIPLDDPDPTILPLKVWKTEGKDET